jgi:rod shape-determining protein MreD
LPREKDSQIRLNAQDLFWMGAVGLGFLLWQTAVQPHYDPRGYGPDLFLLVIIYLGLKAPVTGGASLAVFLGLCGDAAGGGVFGFSSGLHLIMVLGLALIRQQADPTAPLYLPFFLLLFTLGAYAFSFLGLVMLDRPLPLFPTSASSPAVTSLVSAAATALFGSLAFWVFDLVFRYRSGAREFTSP